MGRVQGSSLGSGRAGGSNLIEDQLPRPMSTVRRLVEGLGGHQRPWSIYEQLGALCQEDRLEEVVEHTCNIRRGTRDSKGKGRQGGKSHTVISGQAPQRRKLKYTCVTHTIASRPGTSFEVRFIGFRHREGTRLFSGTLSFSYVFSVMATSVFIKKTDG